MIEARRKRMIDWVAAKQRVNSALSCFLRLLRHLGNYHLIAIQLALCSRHTPTSCRTSEGQKLRQSERSLRSFARPGQTGRKQTPRVAPLRYVCLATMQT